MVRRIKVLILALLFVASFLVGVLVAYAQKPTYIVTATNVPIYRAGLTYIPHNAGCETNEDYHYCYDINSYGFRGKEPIDDARCRVMVVGNSFTFGHGVYNEQTWVALLESDTVQPFNLGQGGASLYDVYDNARAAMSVVHPDVIVIAVTPDYTTDVAALPAHFDGRKPDVLKLEIDGLKALGKPVLLIVLPTQWTWNTPAVHAPLRAFAAAENIPVIVPSIARPMIYPHDGHYNPAGNQAVATQIEPYIQALCSPSEVY